MTAQPRLYIFDVDGTLRWTTVEGQKYPLAKDQWRLMPNVAARLAQIAWSDSGPWLAVASNQTGVGEGLISRQLAHDLIVDTLTAALGRPPPQSCEITMCCCHPGLHCDCRKPEPGMLLHLLARYRVPANKALFVGDLPIDEASAHRAGIPFMWAAQFFGW